MGDDEKSGRSFLIWYGLGVLALVGWLMYAGFQDQQRAIEAGRKAAVGEQ